MQYFAVLNLSDESPQKDSIVYSPHAALEKIKHLFQCGADYVDIGGRSSGAKTPMVSDEVEQQRLRPLFELAQQQGIRNLSLDTWSPNTACKFIQYIDVLNYTSTLFTEDLIQALVYSQCKLVLSYLPADNPYTLRRTTPQPFNIDHVMAYFKTTIQDLTARGVDIMAIDPNLGMWHPNIDVFNIPIHEIQRTIIQHFPQLKTLAPIFTIAPRTKGVIDIPLTQLAMSNGATYIRTHDLEQVLALESARHSLH